MGAEVSKCCKEREKEPRMLIVSRTEYTSAPATHPPSQKPIHFCDLEYLGCGGAIEGPRSRRARMTSKDQLASKFPWQEKRDIHGNLNFSLSVPVKDDKAQRSGSERRETPVQVPDIPSIAPYLSPEMERKLHKQVSNDTRFQTSYTKEWDSLMADEKIKDIRQQNQRKGCKTSRKILRQDMNKEIEGSFLNPFPWTTRSQDMSRGKEIEELMSLSDEERESARAEKVRKEIVDSRFKQKRPLPHMVFKAVPFDSVLDKSNLVSGSNCQILTKEAFTTAASQAASNA